MKKLPALLDTGRDLIARLHRDERGAEGLEKLLIIAAIVIPLLGLLIYFRGQIRDWSQDEWANVRGDAEDWETSPGGSN